VKFVSVPCLLSACFLSPGRCRDVCNWPIAEITAGGRGGGFLGHSGGFERAECQ
jgi:hypothetical protein